MTTMTKCTRCGTSNHTGARFCSKCGAPMTPTAAPPTAAPPVTGPAPTQKLAQAPHFTPLGQGELLQGDRYEVRKCLSRSASRNTYLVEDWGCANCGKVDRKPGKFCENCRGSMAEGRLFLLVEGAAEHEVAGERLLAQRQIKHPRLVNYHLAFAAAPVDTHTRSYVLADPILLGGQAPGTLLARPVSDLPLMSGEDALRYLEEIAPAVDALLEAGLWLPGLGRAQLLLVEHAVQLDAAAVVQPYGTAQAASIAARQAQVMGQLLPQLTTSALPPAVAALLEDPQRALPPHFTMTAFAAALRSAWVGIPIAPQPAVVAVAQASTQPVTPLSAAVVKTQPLSAAANSAPLKVDAGALSDLGNVREINEDSLVKLDVDLVHNSASQPLQLYAVADGMGGHAAGEVASMLAAQELTKSLMGLHSAARAGGAGAAAIDLCALLKGAGQSAAKAVYDQAQQTQTDMGTTLVAALVDARAAKAYIINVGDSRLYKVSGQTIRQVTKDHSMVQLLIDKQQLTPEEARRHPNANLIYRTLGDKSVVEIDSYEESLAAGDALLLCSDGLSGLVDDQELVAAVVQEKTPAAACRHLVDLAKQRGGHDNITVIIARFSILDAAVTAGTLNASSL